jgi:hypothetical protein
MKLTERKKLHDDLLIRLHTLYDDIRGNVDEFIYDGPSDWALYYKSKPRIMFLLKESWGSHHPSQQGLKINTKHMINLARWKIAIENKINNKPCIFLKRESLPANLDDVARVEIKKINTESKLSSNSDIKKYAINDKDYLREQIELINPQIIICCGGSQLILDCYDIIFENHIKNEKKISDSVWLSNNRIVLDFYHPSTPPSYIESDTDVDVQCYEKLVGLLSNDSVKDAIAWVMNQELL